MDDAIRSMPKIDLHHHLDGSLRTSTILELANEQGIDLPANDVDTLNEHVRVSRDCRSLTDFLDCFEVFYPVIQTPESQRRIAYELCEDLDQSNVVYVETRFAPVLLTEEGATQREVVDAVVEGLDEGCEEFDVDINLILCMYRGTPPEESIRTVEIAQQHQGNRIVGVDLAGDESQFEAREHKEAFARVRESGLNLTVHAGEAGGSDNIREAIELGADRIGHGVSLVDDPDLMEEVIDREIPLEICLTSNVQTGVAPSYGEHPVRTLYDEGVPITLNTDDPAVSNIDIEHEFRVAHEELGFTIDDLNSILLTSAESAFADPARKKSLRSTIERFQP